MTRYPVRVTSFHAMAIAALRLSLVLSSSRATSTTMTTTYDEDDPLVEKYCKGNPDWPNHQASLWTSGFPYEEETSSQSSSPPSALCPVYDVNITDDPDAEKNELCVDGRATYGMLEGFFASHDYVDPDAEDYPLPMFQPAVKSVSVNGHLTAGSGNVVLGPHGRYLYDMVTSYTVNGVRRAAADGDLVDDLLAASRGTIDGFCLDLSQLQRSAFWYTISHKVGWAADLDASELTRNDAHVGLVFFSSYNYVVEYHEEVTEAPNALTFWTSRAILFAVNYMVGLFPASLYGVLPVFAVTGLSRLVVTNGVYSTADFPNPFTAPDSLGSVEGVQLDCAWTTLVAAVRENGLFVSDDARVPTPYFNVVIKRIDNGRGGPLSDCWRTDDEDDDEDDPYRRHTAAIDLEAPAGRGEELDAYVNDVVFPALAAHGRVSLHLGKRIPFSSSSSGGARTASDVARSAAEVYGGCGAHINLDADETGACYHPFCERTGTTRDFTYPKKYFEYHDEDEV